MIFSTEGRLMKLARFVVEGGWQISVAGLLITYGSFAVGHAIENFTTVIDVFIVAVVFRRSVLLTIPPMVVGRIIPPVYVHILGACGCL